MILQPIKPGADQQQPSMYFRQLLGGEVVQSAPHPLGPYVRGVTLDGLIGGRTSGAGHPLTVPAWGDPARRSDVYRGTSGAVYRRSPMRQRHGTDPRLDPVQRPSCGSRSGYVIHQRNGERACDECRDANTTWMADYNRRRREQAGFEPNPRPPNKRGW